MLTSEQPPDPTASASQNSAMGTQPPSSAIISTDLSALSLLPLLFYLPLMIACIGKFYMLCLPPNKQDKYLLEELIVFQSKLELYILFYCILELAVKILEPDFSMVLAVIALALILKIKFSCHYGTQKAYREMHLAFDRIARSCGGRGLYQKLYKWIGKGNLEFSVEKVVGY